VISGKLLVGDITGVHRVYLDTIAALRRREIATYDVSSRVRLTKTPAEYMATRESRRELPYEAMLASGRTTWEAGDRVRVYRTAAGAGIVRDAEDDLDGGPDAGDARDYDVEHYVRVLRDTFAQRFVRAFTPEDFAAVFADEQLSLFARPLSAIRPILRVMSEHA